MSEFLGASATRALGIIVYLPLQSHSALTTGPVLRLEDRAKQCVPLPAPPSFPRRRGRFSVTNGPPTSRLVVLRFGRRVACAARSQGGSVERDDEHRQLGPSGPGAVRCLGSCLGQVLAMLRERWR